MGGLVIKRAFILSKQDETYHSIANRVHSIIFLATPRRGSDLAKPFSKILALSFGARPFVGDLRRGSRETESINNEFRLYCQELKLYSFYETLPTSFGITSSLIVAKDLAVLGYGNEQSAYLNANHREVCKFASKNDANYQTVRNTLALIVNCYKDYAASIKQILSHKQYGVINTTFGISGSPEEDFVEIDALRIPGSCEWLIRHNDFLEWQDNPDSKILWISAKPATGKTVLSSMVINYLRGLQKDVCFHHFAYSNVEKTKLNIFLISMARQMVDLNQEVAQTVFEICERNDPFHHGSHRHIWQKLFVDGLLQTKLVRPQYWVIDALDECKEKLELVHYLVRAAESFSIHILVTCRESFEFYRQGLLPKVRVLSYRIREEDTKHDIALYLRQNSHQLIVTGEDEAQKMMTTILKESSACFLWVVLIMQDLGQVHTSKETRQVLQNIPSDMNDLYYRILHKMANSSYGTTLLQAILTWTLCSVRPLTTDELRHALELELDDEIDSIEKSIAASHLVYVDGHRQVQLIHKTARDYLLQAGRSFEFFVDEEAGHKRIVLTCLQYLASSAMNPPQYGRLRAHSAVPSRGAFVSYACHHFFDHIPHLHSLDQDFLTKMTAFLGSSNVLCWIEYLARQSSLHRLTAASRIFQSYSKKSSKHLTTSTKGLQLLNWWATDLVRLVSKFGRHLAAFPPSIFRLIPVFCPALTPLEKQITKSAHEIYVLGLSYTTWDDCVANLPHPSESCYALASSRTHFAIGMSSGKIFIYDADTCQKEIILQHQGWVSLLHFGESGTRLVSVGFKKIRLWDSRAWSEIWHIETPNICLSVTFYDRQRFLLAALANNQLIMYDIESGNETASFGWIPDLAEPHPYTGRRPTTAAFNTERGLLGILYRGQDILIWDMEKNMATATYDEETGATPRAIKRGCQPGALFLVFGSGVNSHLLAVAYADGDLVLFDISEGAIRATANANILKLTCSPDGRLLAAAHASGMLQILEFQTLRPIFRIDSDDQICRMLAFNWKSDRLLDINGSQCQVWDCTIAINESGEEDASDSDFESKHFEEIISQLLEV